VFLRLLGDILRRDLRRVGSRFAKPIVPADDQAMVLPCASVMVMVVLLNDEFTCATPDAMFLRSRRRTRVASLPIPEPFLTISTPP
jgi:hypothetical protein